MATAARQRAILACPLCRTALRDDGDLLVCEGDAAHRYETRGGVPILLSEGERASLGVDLDAASQMQMEYGRGLGARVRGGVKGLLGANRHLPISPTVLAALDERAGSLRLEVGSGLTTSDDGVVTLDIAPFRNVDVVGSALELPFLDGSFAAVRNHAVLEHVREPAKMVAEMHRVLAPGGVCYTEVPFIQHFHAYPNDFQRYTVEGLKEAFHAFEHLETGVCVGPGSALTALAGDYAELWTFSEKRRLNDLARLVPLVLLWPLKFLDRFLVRRNPRSHELASGIYLLARKP